jgi:L-arabinose isomerase
VSSPDGDGTRFTRPVRLGLLTPYFPFFESRFPPDFRSTQERYAARLAEALGEDGIRVIPSGLVDGPESAESTGRRFADADVDVVVAAATMATPPAYGRAALEGFDGPVIVWDDRRLALLPEDLDEVEATRASSLLGSIMLANVLGREDRPYLAVTSVDGDATEVKRVVVGAAASRGLRDARLGLLGGIIPGYEDVLLDPTTAERLGIELVEVVSGDEARALAGSDVEEPDELTRAGLELTEQAAPLLARSLRVHRFLRALVAERQLDALALNCHSEVLRWGEQLGVTACLASTLLWSDGLPISCTGDAATAVALMLLARIAGSAQYCEGYAIEADTGELLVSSCGMADISLRPAGTRARLCPNELYPGKQGLGIATRFDFDAGPATLAAFAPRVPGRPPRLVVAVGRLTGRGFSQLNGPAGTMTFDEPGTGTVSRAWIDAGPAHHLALVRGDRSIELRSAAHFLGIDIVETRRDDA